jgi:hypothetical protein
MVLQSRPPAGRLQAFAGGLSAEPKQAGEDGPATRSPGLAIFRYEQGRIAARQPLRLALHFQFSFPSQDYENHRIHDLSPVFLATGCKTG